MDQAYLLSKFGEITLENRTTIHKILKDIFHSYNSSLQLNPNDKLTFITRSSNLPEGLFSFIESLLIMSNDKILINTSQSDEVTELLKFIVNVMNRLSKK